MTGEQANLLFGLTLFLGSILVSRQLKTPSQTNSVAVRIAYRKGICGETKCPLGCFAGVRKPRADAPYTQPFWRTVEAPTALA